MEGDADFMAEAQSAFAEVDKRSYGEPFVFNGSTYRGTWSPPDITTQMLTGNYQGRLQMRIAAHVSQFDGPPEQRNTPLTRVNEQTEWDVKEINITSTHYVFTVFRIFEA